MKQLIFTLSLISSFAFASGKIQFRPQYHILQKKPGATSGMSVYERLFSDDIHINIWGGLGYRPGMEAEKGILWYATNAALEFSLDKHWSISPGFQMRFSPTFDDKDNSASVQVAYKLW